MAPAKAARANVVLARAEDEAEEAVVAKDAADRIAPTPPARRSESKRLRSYPMKRIVWQGMLQSIIDYTRAPEVQDTGRRGPAIDPVFEMTDGQGWF